jgi:urate oxidase
MSNILGDNRYGKSRVRIMRVTRGAARHQVDEWNVEVWLEGDFRACFEDGDNSHVLPTDTMKNTVYSLARASSATTIEDFALELVQHFIETNVHAALAGVHIKETAWKHLIAGDEQFPTAFTHGEDKRNTTTVAKTRAGGLTIHSGFEDLWLLKTANSAFSGYLKDRLTTLKETSDRLFGTLAMAEWLYAGPDNNSAATDFYSLRRQTETALIRAFAAHDSLSVQQTLYAMAEAALDTVGEVDEVHLSMPNKHCNLVDLSPFGQDNPNHIFVPTDEPHGSITARVRRGA